MSTTLSTPSAASPAAGWEEFRVLLEEQRADCVRQHELAVAETATSLPDPVATRRAATLLATIEEIDGALGRVAAGTYGRCASCGVEIPRERLEIRPYAAGCVSCQASAR